MAGSKSKKSHKTKGNYCFPNFLGDAMKKVSPRVQFEASLLSMSLILIGLLTISIVTIFGTEVSTFIKIMAGVNGAAAFVFLSSHLITTFQQYQGFLAVAGLLKEVNQEEEEAAPEEEDKPVEETTAKPTTTITKIDDTII